MSGDRHIVIVDDQLHVQPPCHRDAGGFGIVAFLLRTIGTQAEHDLVRIRHGHAVHMRPHVAEAAGAEFHARREAQFRVPREFRVRSAIVHEVFERQITINCRHQILGGHAVACFVEENRHELARVAAEEGVHDHHFRHRVVGSAGVPAHAASGAGRGEEHDRVAAELDVAFQGFPLSGGQFWIRRIQRKRFESCGVDRKFCRHDGCPWCSTGQAGRQPVCAS